MFLVRVPVHWAVGRFLMFWQIVGGLAFVVEVALAARGRIRPPVAALEASFMYLVGVALAMVGLAPERSAAHGAVPPLSWYVWVAALAGVGAGICVWLSGGIVVR